MNCKIFTIIFGAALMATASLQAATGSAAYTYDSLGRLTQVTYDNGTTIVFSYDAVGNRANRVTTIAP